MPDIDIQFHATADEIAELIRDSVKKENVHLVTLMSHPFVVKEITCSEIESAVKDGPTERLRFLFGPPELGLKYAGDFDKRHSDQLILDVGRLSSAGLGQSWLACRTENMDAISVWRRIAKALKRMTKAGVTFVNRQNGMSGFDSSFRYSDGAKRLESQGVAMLPLQGPNGPIVKLGDTRES